VGISDMLPLDRNREWGLESVGRYHAKGADEGALVYLVTPGYLKAMGMRLIAGRDFSWQDTPDNQPVLIINQAAARREWPGEDPIGKLACATGKTPDRVIGVIADVRESALERNSSPQIYVPMTQVADVEGATLVVRSRMNPDALAKSVLVTLRSLNPSQPANPFRPLQSLVDHSVLPRRFFALLVSIFATLGALLAALGIYGVISYSVTQKTQEIGVRMALGASSARVQREVLGRTLRLAITHSALRWDTPGFTACMPAMIEPTTALVGARRFTSSDSLGTSINAKTRSLASIKRKDGNLFPTIATRRPCSSLVSAAWADASTNAISTLALNFEHFATWPA